MLMREKRAPTRRNAAPSSTCCSAITKNGMPPTQIAAPGKAPRSATTVAPIRSASSWAATTTASPSPAGPERDDPSAE